MMDQSCRNIIPDGFLWGGAVTSFQMEGAWNEDGEEL
ncbi:family 1 glycosylhydrolase [Parageobacillus sp. VR-IP]|nr:family 1 glycosylhydrolase [Parageobacillus sp. VR-IP]